MSPNSAHHPGATIQVRVNDEPHVVTDSTTLSQLLTDLGLVAAKGIAIAINDVVAPRSSWDSCRLSAGDQILLIQATQGG